jgi:peptidoglycan hydrolase-like protein with peptidoglycan-binding domain
MLTNAHHKQDQTLANSKKDKRNFFQPKLAINQPNDLDSYRDEKEADAVADHVMYKPDHSLRYNSFFKPSISSVQRKCAHCEEEEKKMQRKENSNDDVHVSGQTQNYIQSISGGSKLNEEDRKFFGSKMGYDFSDVRLHTGTEANESAKNINALAYTHSNDIVFNSGQYQSNTHEGKKLLAHELTHVVQQNGGITSNTIQRVPDTSLDRGHELTSTALSGDPVLKSVFDNRRIIGIGEHGAYVKKIQNGLLTLGIALPQFGADSSYGTETSNAVKDFQRRAGMSAREQDGIVGRKTIGLLDRSLRNGVISTDTDNAASDFTFTPEANAACNGPTTQPCDTWYHDIDDLIGESTKLIEKTVAEQLPPHKTQAADYESIFATLFRNGDASPLSSTVDKVSQNYWLTRTYMNQLRNDRSLIVCGTQCDGGCAHGSPAHEIKKVVEANNVCEEKKVIVFCPSFRTHADRVLILLHESHHAAVDGSKDWAYPSERLITMLDHDKALLNAASFHLYAQAVKDPKNFSMGHAVKDVNNISNATERDKVNRCLAFVEHWFRLITYDLSDTIAGTRDARNTGKYSNRSAEQTMAQIMHPWFGLTSPPSRPSQTDIDKLTAIEQRCVVMEEMLKKSYTINLVNGASRWLTTPQNTIEVNNATTGLPDPQLCVALVQELVHATPNISADTESLYVGMINEMRNARNFDPQT